MSPAKKRQMNMKRIHTLLTAAVLLLSAPGTVLPAAADDLYSGKAGQNVTWNYAPDTHTLTFSGNGLMSSYCEFDPPTPRDTPWKRFVSSIRHVKLEEGVRSIGGGAFY